MPELPPFNNPPPRLEAASTEDTPPSPMGDIPEQPEPGRWQGVSLLFAWIFRWALLGVGVSGVWFLGVLVAQFFPATNPQPPLQEIVVRRTHRFIQKVRRLPAWWTGDTFRDAGPTTTPRLAAESVTSAPAVRPVSLSDDQRGQITAELEAIQAELQQLRDRTSALENQLGLPTMELSLEVRLGSVASRLSPTTEAPQAPDTSSPSFTEVASESTPDPLFQSDADRVTLPSDVLFAPGETGLQPNAGPLLDSILLDIGRYPGATVLVGSYTDIQVDETTPVSFSYQQALTVQRYLSQRLGDDTYHWVAVGYGNTSLGTTGGAQLSRRVTISIVPF